MMVMRVDRPFNMLIGNGSLTFVTGQPRNCCAKFCSCRTLCSILAATMRQAIASFARLSHDRCETNLLISY